MLNRSLVKISTALFGTRRETQLPGNQTHRIWKKIKWTSGSWVRFRPSKSHKPNLFTINLEMN